MNGGAVECPRMFAYTDLRDVRVLGGVLSLGRWGWGRSMRKVADTHKSKLVPGCGR